MADAKVNIEIGADTKPLEQATKKAEKDLNRLADEAKKSGSKIDEAFKSAGGKVQEALGPLGKLLGPTALQLGALGLAAGAMGAAVNKAFEMVSRGAEAAKRLGAESRLTGDQLRTLVGRADEAKRAMDRFDEALGTVASTITARLSPAVEGIAGLMTGAVSWQTALTGTGLNQVGAGAFSAGQAYVPTRNAVLDNEEVLRRRRAELKAQRDRQEALQRAEDARRAAIAERRFREAAELGSQPDWSTWVQIQEAQYREAESLGSMPDWNTWVQIQQDRLVAPRPPPRRAPMQMSFFDRMGPYAGMLGQAGGQLVSGLMSGQSVGGSIASGLGSIASSAATMLLGPLGPIAGELISGATDALAMIFNREDERSKARREAREKMRAQWSRDTAAARRSALPEFDPFLGMRGRTTIVNVQFNGPVGSPGRIARQLADSLGGGQ